MKQPVVLVVDDSPTVRSIVQRILSTKDIKVIFAADGLSALSLIVDEQPALILLDIQLPYMDGYHLCQIIRKNLVYKEVPIIMLTRKDGLFDRMRGRLAGTTEYLAKPFDALQLLQVVSKHLENWEERTQERVQEERVHIRRRRQTAS